jgi:oligopeptide/dipeptide ABC transporter ATP-binding protein
MPGVADMPSGCAFHTRCAYALPECRLAIPELVEMADGHLARCIRAGHLSQETESAA